MNGVFNYIEKKKGKLIPFEFKIINKLPLTKGDLIINGDLNLWGSNITYLPDNIKIYGDLNLSCSTIKLLPNNLKVLKDLSLVYTKLEDLPYDLIVDGDLWCWNTPLATNIKNDVSLLTKYQKQIKGRVIYDYRDFQLLRKEKR